MPEYRTICITLAITMQDLAIKLKKHSLLIFVIFAIIVYKLIGYLYFLVLSMHYSSYIPTSLEIDKTVFAGDQIGGFIEGCGVAVFKLSENTSENISVGGVEFLNKNSAISDSSPVKYKKWQETPFVFERNEYPIFRHLANEDAGGNTCVDVPTPLKEKILSAIEIPGGFYSRAKEHNELIVIPSIRLAIFSHER